LKPAARVSVNTLNDPVAVHYGGEVRDFEMGGDAPDATSERPIYNGSSFSWNLGFGAAYRLHSDRFIPRQFTWLSGNGTFDVGADASETLGKWAIVTLSIQ
jgi:hypothetical protein